MPRKKKKFVDDIDLGSQTSYSDDDDDYEHPKRRGKKFWNLSKIFIVFVFLLGLLIGGILTNQFIDPTLNTGMVQDYNSLVELNEVLDSQADSYYQCLMKNGINPDGDC